MYHLLFNIKSIKIQLTHTCHLLSAKMCFSLSVQMSAVATTTFINIIIIPSGVQPLSHGGHRRPLGKICEARFPQQGQSFHHLNLTLFISGEGGYGVLQRDV